MPPQVLPLADFFPFGLIALGSLAALPAVWSGVVAIVLLPFAKCRGVGRRCANYSLAVAVIALPLYLLAAPATNIAPRIHTVALVTLAIGLLSSAAYFRRSRRRGGPGVA